MFIIDDFRVKIEVRVNPGVYSFQTLSGTGKTYLCKLCKKYHGYGLDIDGYNYYDYKLGNLLPANVRLLVIDRYTMFQDVFMDEIYKLGETAIVLVDLKDAAFEHIAYLSRPSKDLIVING